MTDEARWALYMNINQKACDLIKGKDVKFTETELYQIAYTFGGEATILKRKCHQNEE